jgi:hypothetical protein
MRAADTMKQENESVMASFRMDPWVKILCQDHVFSCAEPHDLQDTFFPCRSKHYHKDFSGWWWIKTVPISDWYLHDLLCISKGQETRVPVRVPTGLPPNPPHDSCLA